MKLFVADNICRNRSHCATCRDTGDAGRAWRESAAKHWHLPDDDVNFACPFGVPWGAIPQPPPQLMAESHFKGGCCG